MAETAPQTQRRTQEERKAESERRIIRAAIELFATQGFMKTTMNQVGAAAGYTGGLVSHRFGSKEGLLKAVVARISSRFLEDQLRPGIDSRSAGESLNNIIRIYLEEVTVRQSRIRALYVIMGEALGAVPEIQQDIAVLNQGFRDSLANAVQRGIDQGEFRSGVDPEAAAILILGLLRGVTMQVLADPEAIDVKTVIPLVQDSALAGLKVPSSPSPTSPLAQNERKNDGKNDGKND